MNSEVTSDGTCKASALATLVLVCLHRVWISQLDKKKSRNEPPGSGSLPSMMKNKYTRGEIWDRRDSTAGKGSTFHAADKTTLGILKSSLSPIRNDL